MSNPPGMNQELDAATLKLSKARVALGDAEGHYKRRPHSDYHRVMVADAKKVYDLCCLERAEIREHPPKVEWEPTRTKLDEDTPKFYLEDIPLRF